MSRHLTLLGLLLATATLLLPLRTASACSCFAPPTVESSLSGASDAFVVTIDTRFEFGQDLTYFATVRHAVKGCTEPGEEVLLVTSPSSASCGVTNLRQGRQYLVFGYASDASYGIDVFDIGACDYNLPVGQVTRRDWRYLVTHTEACGAPSCEDLEGEDFGMCDMVLGYGVISDACQAISGCSSPPGLTLASSMRECEAAWISSDTDR